MLPYRLFKPANIDPARKYPLILFLHGAGERGADNQAQVRDALHFTRPDIQREHPCFVLAPQCPLSRPVFAVYGSSKMYDQTFNTYAPDAGKWKNFTIPLSNLPPGEIGYLFLINSQQRRGEAANPAEAAMSQFRNIKIFEADSNAGATPPLNLKDRPLNQRQGNGEAKVSADGLSISLSGSLRLAIALKHRVTPRTVINFDFRSERQGAAHAITLSPEPFLDYRWVDMDWSASRGAMPAHPSMPLRLTMEVVDQLMKELPIDPARVYVTGLSMGGYGTWDIVARRPDFFAAAVPICGGADESTAKTIKDVPIWCFHGGADATVKPQRSRTMIAALKEAGGHPRYTEYPGVGHNSWDKAYAEPELAQWLFAQKKPDASPPKSGLAQ